MKASGDAIAKLGDANASLVEWLAENELPQHDTGWTSASWQDAVRRRLMKWFRRQARDLPWRQNVTPYRVWISEIMLQQTQVATVIDYYHRFMKSFPTVHHLAQASEQSVLSHWEGLGYYRRARSLHAAARKIVDEHDGVFPTSYHEVLALPGIGRYTAGAILSISDGQKLPILEGNTQRVFSRWIASRSPVSDRQAIKLLWKVAEAVLPTRNPGVFNQGAMELGALICRPTSPSCDQCPVAMLCQAKLLGIQEEIPGKVKKIEYADRIEFAFVVAEDSRSFAKPGSRYLIRRLPEGGRWAGLWDFPRTTEQDYQSVEDACRGIHTEVGVPLQSQECLMTIRHAVTRFRIQLKVYSATDHVGQSTMASSGIFKVKRASKPWRFATLEEMRELPMSVTGRKIARHLESMDQ